MSAWLGLLRSVSNSRHQPREPRLLRQKLQGVLDRMQAEGRCGWPRVTLTKNRDNHGPHLIALQAGPLALEGSEALDDVRLRLSAELSPSKVLEAYSVGLAGTVRGGGASWYVRIDLDPVNLGRGPCSHAMLHCHVGDVPKGNALPEVRVPMPWLEPDEALAWLLTQVYEDLEPRIALSELETALAPVPNRAKQKLEAAKRDPARAEEHVSAAADLLEQGTPRDLARVAAPVIDPER